MRHWVTYPMVTHPFDPAFATKDAVTRFARTAEAAGFDGMGFTDHPAPSDRWLRSGGHDALDPFAALAFVAAVTDRLLLIPNIVVLPYRNPFLVAKAVATIDALSGGRFVLSTAVGYQRAEYRALGVDFEERNDLFDEALEVLRGIWSTDDFAYEGRHFTAKGQTANPKPQRAPIWIGGNSQKARRRAATVADGWNPFPAPKSIAATTKTVALETLDDLAPLLVDLWRRVDEAGRDRAEVDVSFSNLTGGDPGSKDFEADAALQGVADLAALGVTWTSISVPGDSVEHALEALERYGKQVIRAG
ncbi:MAG: LLM class F420-dependent oxidoreductase [Acidimicrobiales bacterium]